MNMYHLDYYPNQVCHKCGMAASAEDVMHNVAAVWHVGKCDVCKGDKVVTSPDNFGSPEFKGYKP